MEELKRQIRQIDKKKEFLKKSLTEIEKGIENGKSEFSLKVKGDGTYKILSILLSSGIGFSYQYGNLKIQKNK